MNLYASNVIKNLVFFIFLREEGDDWFGCWISDQVSGDSRSALKIKRERQNQNRGFDLEVKSTFERGHPRSGQAIRALAQGFQGGYALVTSLAVEASEAK